MSMIIKRIDARHAWIQVDDDTARLIVFKVDTTSANMSKRGDEIIARRKRRSAINQRLEELRNGITK